MDLARTSVVIIFLNGEAFLEEAIESVRLQTNRSWELLLVDDGSRDASAQIAQRAVCNDPQRVRYIQHPDGGNHGTSASRNIGAEHARGDYLLFLDCDDLLLPTNLERHVAILDAHPDLAAVFSPTLFWLWDRAYAEDSDSIQSVGGFGDTRIAPPALLLAMLEDESLHPANCGTLFRRRVFADCGAFENSFTGMYEDTALLTKVLMHHPTYMIGECLSAYRAHRASQCNSARETGEYSTSGPSRSRFTYLEWARRYACQQARVDVAVLRAIDHELDAYTSAAGQRVPRKGLRSIPRRAWRWIRRHSERKRPVDSLRPVVDVLRTLHATYLAMHRAAEAAVVTERIAELEGRHNAQAGLFSNSW